MQVNGKVQNTPNNKPVVPVKNRKIIDTDVVNEAFRRLSYRK